MGLMAFTNMCTLFALLIFLPRLETLRDDDRSYRSGRLQPPSSEVDSGMDPVKKEVKDGEDPLLAHAQFLNATHSRAMTNIEGMYENLDELKGLMKDSEADDRKMTAAMNSWYKETPKILQEEQKALAVS